MTDLIDAPTTPIERTTPIKPSEALRLGRLIYPEHNTNSELVDGTTACALGAMMAGWGVDPHKIDNDYTVAQDALGPYGLDTGDIYSLYDETVEMDGDGAVLKFLESKGL